MRSPLADALELRIAERTRDLDAARRGRGGHAETRYVAAAVHDLLQPLNAARTSSLLRGHALDEPGQVADSIDGALAADRSGYPGQPADISHGVGPAGGASKATSRSGRCCRWCSTTSASSPRAAACALTAGCRYTVRSDEALLRRILQNLLSNAIRYTPGGKVLIGCRRHGDQLRIEVHDQAQAYPRACSARSSSSAAWARP